MNELLKELIALVERVRVQRPLVHYLPNLVTANDVANALLAFGASPIMATAPEEVADIRSAALGLNLGVPSKERIAAMHAAGRAAAERGAPIVFDPVGVGATPFRLQAAQRLLAELPIAILRLNADEARALLTEQATAPGIDAIGAYPDQFLAQALAQRFGCVAAITGPVDVVSDGERTLLIENGVPALTRVTGAGCMTTGLIAACVAVAEDPWPAAGAALLAFGVAAEIAVHDAHGPASLRTALIDALYNLKTNHMYAYGRVRTAP